MSTLKAERVDTIKVNKYITFILQIEPWYEKKYRIFSAGVFYNPEQERMLDGFVDKLGKKYKIKTHHYGLSMGSACIVKEIILPGCLSLKYEMWHRGSNFKVESASEKEIMKTWKKLKSIVKMQED